MLLIKAIEQKYKFIKIDKREGGMYLSLFTGTLEVVTPFFSDQCKPGSHTPTQGPTEQHSQQMWSHAGLNLVIGFALGTSSNYFFTSHSLPTKAFIRLINSNAQSDKNNFNSSPIIKQGLFCTQCNIRNVVFIYRTVARQNKTLHSNFEHTGGKRLAFHIYPGSGLPAV